jgi:competence protein ComEC
MWLRSFAESAKRLLPLALLLIAATGAMLAGFLLGRRPAPAPSRRLEVTVVNVGHGEASWVRTPSGHFVLIGGGPPGAGERVARALRAAGAQRIDLLLVPYPYAEAIGGLPEILGRFPVTQAAEPGYPPPGERPVNAYQTRVRDLLRASQVPVRVARAGEVLRLDDTRIEILGPGEPLVRATPSPANNSLVVRVTWRETSFLWAGGLERPGENALLARGGGLDLRADWLRVARFGTGGATSPEFLRRVQPSIAVISVGNGNAAGFPHAETLARLEAAGARVLRTDQPPAGADAGGDLRFTSDGTHVHGPDEPR